MGVDAVDLVGAGGEQTGQVAGAGTDVQRAAEAVGELPQDPAVVVGVVVPEVSGVECPCVAGAGDRFG
ncbi:acetyl-CoA carboxylase carboxyltransferase component [Streptomyces sp. SAI-129]